ncbi:protein mono-ADP-ribosyltransferase PARP14-like isoform X2 [Heliangelus exortis]|uniref:protein mono-ADP-ribosyltransferase PARP14-like isoform X2 n=1 Tax=Heliangelus exortis TaxID=472823 RepID=UPI003A9592B1
MAEKRSDSFPLLVRGDWGPDPPPPALRKKLVCYFQNRKQSDGGECELRTGTGTGDVLLCFVLPEVKQRVLEKKSHKLYWGGKEIKLIVSDPERPPAAEKNTLQEKSVPTKAPGTTSNIQAKDDVEALQKAEGSVVNRALQEETGAAGNIAEKSAEASPSVVFENITRCSPEELHILLENISNLSGDDDFTVEEIHEINAAVATFKRSIDIEEFVRKCRQHKIIKEQKITARILELTKSIKAENLPDSVSRGYITIYFESAWSGGGKVSEVQLFPEENSAIVTFRDQKDLNTVLKKQHVLDETKISVHPYYHSLGAALYGKERPTIKMPDPIEVPLDQYVWQFLQRHGKLIKDINQEMAVFHCDLKWPEVNCSHPEITLCPSFPLSKQKKPMIKLIKTWKQDASNEFSRIMSRYTAVKCRVYSVNWEDLKKRLVKDFALLITDVSEGLVVIAGSRAGVESAEKKVTEYVEKAIKESEREKQTIEISVPVVPGIYAILQNAGQENNIRMEYPSIKIFYSDTQKAVQLHGLPAEVHKIEAEILKRVYNMPHKTVKIDPQVFHYLQRLDTRAMSALLFTRKKINAFYELRDDTVMLFGGAHKDLSEAEQQIKTDLEYVCIDVEDGEVIKKEEWRSLVSSLLKMDSSSQGTLVIDEPTGKQNKVIIAGISEAVKNAHQKLSNFLDRNIYVKKVIPANSAMVVQFVEKKKSSFHVELRKKGVTVGFDTETPCFSLSGPRTEVPKAVTSFEKILSSLYLKNVTNDKPGAKELFIERKDLCVLEAEQKFGCLIQLEQQEVQEQKDGRVADKEKLYCEEVLPNGVVVAVYKGNLCDYPVDVVVNATNEGLQHHSGLAEALSEAAGPELQEECNELVRKNGSLKPGCTVITGAGKLPCKNVIHAVGPRWRAHEAEKCLDTLKETVKNCLKLADTYNHRSIALPVISGGVFGFPLQMCARSIVSSIKETLEGSMKDSDLKKIHLVDDVEEVVQVLCETVKKVFTAGSYSLILMVPRSESDEVTEGQKEERKEDLQMFRTNEGLSIHVEEKKIQEATTDVIVNSVGLDLMFGVGPLCRALLEKAGVALQREFNLEKRTQAYGPGSVVCTSGCALACKYVLHAILPPWDGRGGQALESLHDVIHFCLKKTEEFGLKSIAFPALGTGGFKFPKNIVSKLMFDVVFKFSRNHTWKNLQEVHFFLDPKDTDNIQAFTIELGHRVVESCNAASLQPKAKVFGVHEIQIGSITLQITNGDITEEDTEVIVNILNDKCNVTKAGQSHRDFITTQGGKLLCNKIIHLLYNNDVENLVSKVLNECELRTYKSVAFPAIGTGQGKLSPREAADDMLDAIVEFARERSVQHLKKIRIIIFQTTMLRDFYTSMKKREHSCPSTKESQAQIKSFFFHKTQPTKKEKHLALEKKIYLATFQICGVSKQKVEETEAWINKLILNEQIANIVSDELIEHFDERQINALTDLQKKSLVTIQLENKSPTPQIKISGISKDVCFVSGEVQKMIKKMKDTKLEEYKAELVFNQVEWRYLGSNDRFVAFDKLTNMQLEDAKIAKKPHLTVKIDMKNYQVDLKSLQANDDQGKTISIQRVPKNEDQQSIELPIEWEDMKDERVKLVPLQPSSQEYLEVKRKFQKTCHGFVIKKIERVQNPYLWKQYQIKKISISRRNKNENIEKMLFHGTTSSSLSKINYKGFDRGFSGKNAARFGKGTYFALDAIYSATETYSKPDSNNRRYMYLARVLTGKYCAATGELVEPPPRNPAEPYDLYDSVVDNIENPSMFVIFSDTQAYPAYLITFQK